MNRPVVLLTNAILADQEGGLYRYVSELASALARRGVAVTVLTKQVEGRPAAETTADGVRIERYAVPSKAGRLFALRYPFTVFRAVRAALRRHPDAVVHAHFPVPALVPLLTRRPFLYTFHSPVHRELLGERQGSYALPRAVQGTAVAGLRAAEAWLLRRAHRVVLLSSFSRDEVALLSARAARRALLCPGGVDVDRFTPSPTPARAEDEGPLYVLARRLVWRTGALEAVAAMEQVVATHPRARLVVLGDGLLREEVQRRVVAAGLEGNVTLLGHVGDADLLDWYRRATLVLMPTQELEGFGLVSAEAMACGTPVVATPVGANPEVVGSFSDGALMTASKDPRDIAAAVLAVTKEVAAGRWTPEQVRAHVAPRCGWDAVADAHVGLYAELAGRTAPR